MFTLRLFFIALSLAATTFSAHSLKASHGSSRYFPFIQRVELGMRPPARGHVDVSFFHTTASTAYATNGNHRGITQLWGDYDVQDVVASLNAVGIDTNAIYDVVPAPYRNKYKDAAMAFKVDGKIKSYGFWLGYEHCLPCTWGHIGVGAQVPFMHVVTTSRYHFLASESDQYFTQDAPSGESAVDKMLNADAIRRNAHKLLGLKGNEWLRSGFGDLDIYLRANFHVNYALLMKRIDVTGRLGVLLPTSARPNRDYPSSVPFGSNGATGLYIETWFQGELKQDLTVGLMVSGLHRFANTETVRLSVEKEPAVYSALIAPVRTGHGGSFVIMPYITASNWVDGFHISGRYTYQVHTKDRFFDKRTDHTISSVIDLNNDFTEAMEKRSRWSMHYVTLHLLYDVNHDEPENDGRVHSKIYASYDIPWRGYSVVKTHQINLGLAITF